MCCFFRRHKPRKSRGGHNSIKRKINAALADNDIGFDAKAIRSLDNEKIPDRKMEAWRKRVHGRWTKKKEQWLGKLVKRWQKKDNKRKRKQKLEELKESKKVPTQSEWIDSVVAKWDASKDKWIGKLGKRWSQRQERRKMKKKHRKEKGPEFVEEIGKSVEKVETVKEVYNDKHGDVYEAMKTDPEDANLSNEEWVEKVKSDWDEKKEKLMTRLEKRWRNHQ